MVEIISPPNSRVILAYGQLIAVTKLVRRHPLQGLKYWSGMARF